MDTKDKWIRRKKIVLPTASSSMCEILRKSEKEDKSLGTFQPKDIEFYWTKARTKDEAARETCYAQLGFFNKQGLSRK